jgi:hypothetical protein
VVEALAALRPRRAAQALRGVALELERLANHTGDLGALAGDVGYLPTASYCGRIRGDFLNLTAELCGSRFGRGLARPGGAAFDVDQRLASVLAERLAGAAEDCRSRDRAPVGHAVGDGTVRGYRRGAARDRRVARPASAPRRGPRGSTATCGAITPPHLRASARSRSRSATRATCSPARGCAGSRSSARSLPARGARTTCRPVPPATPSVRRRPERLAVALVEGWRGEICHVAWTDAPGGSSATRWSTRRSTTGAALAFALRGQQISDFPLCNKSFNLSYCGHDL